MPPEEQDQTNAVQPEQDTPATPPNPAEERAARLEAELETLKRQREEDRQLLAAAVSYSSNRAAAPAQQTYQPPAKPLEEEEGLSDEARMVAKRLREEFQGELRRREQEWANGYTSNRAVDQARWAELAKRDVVAKYKRAYPDIDQRIDRYIRDNRIGPEYLSQPEAVETLALMQIGQIEADRRMAEMEQSPNLGPSRGRRAATEPAESMFTEEDMAPLRRSGIDLDPAEAEFLLKKSEEHRFGVSATEFAAFSQQRRQRGTA